MIELKEVAAFFAEFYRDQIEEMNCESFFAIKAKEKTFEIAVIDCSEVNSSEFAVIVINSNLECVLDARYINRINAIDHAIEYLRDLVL